MAKGVFTGPFLDDVSALSEDDERLVWQKIELVLSFPGVGSALVEPSLRAAFGPSCLKAQAGNYHALYDCDDASDLVVFLGVVYQRCVC